MRRRSFVVFSLSFIGLMACGPDGGSSSNNNQQEVDAYVFPDASQRPDAAACEDRCAHAGDVQCVTGGYQVCGNYDADDCLEWGPVQPCDEGEKCVDGECQATCVNDCTGETAVRCDPDGDVEGVQPCELGDDGCWHWGDTVACDEGETCSAGTCSSTCHDECADTGRQCAGDGYQVCGNYDSDDCLEWGPITPCGQGETCSNGECSSACTNECTQNAKRCDGAGGYQECGDFDADSCLEWGSTTPCPQGETCSGGVCSATCEDECEDGQRECTASGDGFRVCAVNDSGCAVWGPVNSCDSGESCQNGECVEPCSCDFFPNVCEAASPGSTTACSCDDDCANSSACTSDGHCDTWCPSGADPDCACTCDYNEYCEAADPDSSDICSCDPDCEPHEEACSDDGHCDIFCPDGVDPDCPADTVDPCRDRWMSIGWLWGDELMLDGSYETPDPDEGDSWVLLSPDFVSGSGEIFVEFAAEHADCVTGIRIEVYGYDDALLGDGAEFYVYNWDTFRFDLLADQTVGADTDLYDNDVVDPQPYMYCGSEKCYVDAKIGASGWDNTHLLWVEVYVHMAP